MPTPPASAVIVCPPTWIASNPETAQTNAYQHEGTEADRNLATRQFFDFTKTLREAHIEVLELNPPLEAPDAVFPNNWFSTHHDGTLALYPMLAESRRRERNLGGLSQLLEKGGFAVEQLRDFTEFEKYGRNLEGTGSIVFDHTHRIAYACTSPRTHPEVLAIACASLDYQPVAFEAADAEMPIYHTNVAMAVGSDFAVVCLEAVAEPKELLTNLHVTGKTIIDITRAQMRSFCGNVIELAGPIVLMSTQAHEAFLPTQRAVLERNRSIIHADISAIERMGGGSARCMVAEIFLPKGSETDPSPPDE